MIRTRKVCVVCVCAVIGALSVDRSASAVSGETILVSKVGAFGPAADGDSSDASTSADGRFVAFRSDADDLSTEDNNGFSNIFVRDVQEKTTTLVSRATGTTGAAGDGNSTDPAISADGRYVAFASIAPDMTSEDTNGLEGVFVRDLGTDTTTYVSRVTGEPGAAADGDSAAPSISADGRMIAFYSNADDLSTEDNNGVFNVFVRDLETDVTTFVSRAAGLAGAAGDATSDFPAISADGRMVAFESFANNLSTEDDNTVENIFVRDLGLGTTTFVSRATGAAGTAADGTNFSVAISADGRFVAFASDADNFSIEDDDSFTDIFVRDVRSDTTTFVSRATGLTGTAGNGTSLRPSISADGRFVAFDSFAPDLGANDSDAVVDVFVRDLRTGSTTFVSRGSDPPGFAGNDDSSRASISADGRFVAFESSADNLSPEDTSAFGKIFMGDVLGPQPAPALSINNVSKREGRTGTKAFTFTVTLSGTPGRFVSVEFTTQDGTAKSPSDYVATNGVLTFAPGELTKSVTVSVVGDRRAERSEKFRVLLQAPSGAAIADGVGTGTIRNDDG